jgi:hypothetical protein
MKSIKNMSENCNKNGAIKKRGRRVPNYAQRRTAVRRAIQVRDDTNKNMKCRRKDVFGRQHLPLKI